MLASTLYELYLSVNLLFCKVVVPLRLYLRALFDTLRADLFNYSASNVDEKADSLHRNKLFTHKLFIG